MKKRNSKKKSKTKSKNANASKIIKKPDPASSNEHSMKNSKENMFNQEKNPVGNPIFKKIKHQKDLQQHQQDNFYQ